MAEESESESESEDEEDETIGQFYMIILFLFFLNSCWVSG